MICKFGFWKGILVRMFGRKIVSVDFHNNIKTVAISYIFKSKQYLVSLKSIKLGDKQ